MILGLSMWSYYKEWKNSGLTIPGFIHIAKSEGVDGVELLDFFWHDMDTELTEVDTALIESGLPVATYSVANNFVNADPIARSAEVKKIVDGIDMASHFGAKVVRVFAGNPVPHVSFDQSFDWIVEGLSEASILAESAGVILALENHGSLAGKSEQIHKILKTVGSPNLKANLDTGNFLLVHQAPHEAVNSLAKDTGMVHFKDFAEVPEDYSGTTYLSIDGLKYKGVAIGEGDVALAVCIKELEDAGFNGWLNIEYEGDEPAETAIPRSIKNTRKLLNSRL